MKTLLPWILLGAVPASAQGTGEVTFIRQHQPGTGIVWDMPAAASHSLTTPPALKKGSALFQLWSVKRNAAKDSLRDQKLVGAYLPAAELKITTLDPCTKVARTRVDQPFTVEINLAGLLPANDFPRTASSVVLERHLASYPAGQATLDRSKILSGIPSDSAYLSENGKTSLRFPASRLTAEDPTKACGEEHFVIHAVSDGSLPQTQIAAGFVQVWPVASGEIKGIANGSTLDFEVPKIELVLNDLYPRSDTYLMLFEGTQVAGNEGMIVKSHPLDSDTSESTVIRVPYLDSRITRAGTYTLALVSDTVFGRELLCDPVTFEIKRNMQASTAQAKPGHRGKP
jgi:hypothetical protein